MLKISDFKTEPLTTENSEKAYEFITLYNKFYNIPFKFFLRATLNDLGYDEELNLILKEKETGKIIAVFLTTVKILENIQKCFIKVFIIKKGYRRLGLGTDILNDINIKCKQKNISIISYGASPPAYWEPGLDIRHTDLYFFFKKHKFRERGLRFNLTVNLDKLELKPKSQVNDCQLMRATSQDLGELYEFVKSNFPSQVWPEEVKLSFNFNPPTTFLAKNASGKIVGWATHSNFYPGSFGPTGVLTQLHGQGVGKELLYWCLDDIKSSGLNTCTIMWVEGDTRKFYSKAAGAYIHPIYYILERKIK